jgi:hypothetical protein
MAWEDRGVPHGISELAPAYAQAVQSGPGGPAFPSVSQSIAEPMRSTFRGRRMASVIGSIRGVRTGPERLRSS